MEEIFNDNPAFNKFIRGEIGCFAQKYEGIDFWIFRNLNDTCDLAIPAASLAAAYEKRDVCASFATDAKTYINSQLSC